MDLKRHQYCTRRWSVLLRFWGTCSSTSGCFRC